MLTGCREKVLDTMVMAAIRLLMVLVPVRLMGDITVITMVHRDGTSWMRITALRLLTTDRSTLAAASIIKSVVDPGHNSRSDAHLHGDNIV
jgi:hypothetical protein